MEGRLKRVGHEMRKQIARRIWLLMMGVSMSANAGLFGFGGTSWKEEVLLHDGNRIIVERSVDRGGRHEIGQEPPIKKQSLSFILPSTNENVIWEDKFTQDIGGANFLPMLLEVRKDTAYLVVNPMGCLSYNKWGRPNPPYVIFNYQSGTWQRIPLQDFPVEFKAPNLIFSSPDREAAKHGGVVSAEAIRKLYDGYKQPEYKTILRESMPNVSGRCGEMVYDGNGGWIGTGWFRDQPSHDACLKFCESKKIGARYCPCEILFKGK